MPLISATTRTLQMKIVYYGPGLSGKTTNLEQLSQLLDPKRIGELTSLDTTGDRTLFFDWIPVDLGQIKGFDVKIQLFTVPGQVRYNNTRKKVLQGADALVFVADCQAEALDQNRYSFQNLRENLAERGIDLEDLPVVIQWNKSDLPTAMAAGDLAARLNLEHYPSITAVAYEGEGVLATLRLVTKLALNSVRAQLDPDAELPDDAEQMPLDGDSLMERIMMGDDEIEDVPEPMGDAEMPEILEDSSSFEHDVMEDETPVILGGETQPDDPGPLAARLSSLEAEVRLVHDQVRKLGESLPIRVADSVEREVEPTTEKVADLESRVGIIQRVVTRLGGRVDVLERRVARLEIADRQPERSGEMQEMAGHVHDLSRLMAAFARRLSAPSGLLPQAGPAAEGLEDGVEETPEG
jgi:signal recognition particle receptor subunit beta